MLVVSCSKVFDGYCSHTYGNINSYSYVQTYVGLWQFVCVILVIISTIIPVVMCMVIFMVITMIKSTAKPVAVSSYS